MWIGDWRKKERWRTHSAAAGRPASFSNAGEADGRKQNKIARASVSGLIDQLHREHGGPARGGAAGARGRRRGGRLPLLPDGARSLVECEPISISYVISGVLPTWLNGRNDKMGTVQGLWACANQYKEQNPGFVLASFCIVYITLQTFAIPGPIVLSILSGAMYPFLQAQLLVSFCATTGASLCFALSYFLGRGLFKRLFASMIATFKDKIQQNQSNLFYYLLFLRITPLLPNWFVNIASPLVDVPFKYFFLATLIGLIPANFLHISTGATLNSAAGESGGSNAVNFAILFSLQFVALLPTLFKSKIESYEKRAFEKAKTK